MTEGEPKDTMWPEESRLDSAWVHGRRIDEGNLRKVQCIYCSQVITSSITGLKKHLARVRGCVRPCPQVPKPVTDGFRANFEKAPPYYTWTLKKKQKDVPLYVASHNRTTVNTYDDETAGTAIKQREHSRGRGSLLAKKVAGSAKKNASTYKRGDDVIGMRISSTQGAPKEGRVNNPMQNSPDRAKMSLQKLFSRICKDSAAISWGLEYEGLIISNEMNTDVVKHAEDIRSIRNGVLKIKSEATQLAKRCSKICDK